MLHATKLRYQVSVLDSWHRSHGATDVDQVIAELGAALLPTAAWREAAELLRSRLGRLRTEERRLVALEADLARLRRTASTSQANMEATAGRDAQSAGVFATDMALARWLIDQANDDLRYTRIDLNRTRHMRTLTNEELDQAERAHQRSSGPAAPSHSELARRVFMVHGRDTTLARRFSDLLRDVHLEPLECGFGSGCLGRGGCATGRGGDGRQRSLRAGRCNRGTCPEITCGFSSWVVVMWQALVTAGFRDHDAERDQGVLTAVFDGSAPRS